MRLVPVSAVTALAALLVVAGLAFRAGAEESPAAPPAPAARAPTTGVTTEIRKTDAGERILVQTLRAKATRDAAWTAYTTASGWTSWAVTQAEIDLRIGGKIRTRYDTTGKVGDPGTISLTVVNYVPKELLTLQADALPNWPEVLREDAAHLYNVIVFRELDGGIVEVVSYGTGYRDDARYDQILGFFAKANEGLLRKLQAVLEKGAK